jgi:hypothetical protein
MPEQSSATGGANIFPMKIKLILAIAAAAVLPVAGIAGAEESASDQSTQNAELNKLLTEVNTAPADQKISAIVTLLNKLVEQRKAINEQAQQAPAPKKDKGMCMCSEMMKSDQSGQQSDQPEHSHH